MRTPSIHGSILVLLSLVCSGTRIVDGTYSLAVNIKAVSGNISKDIQNQRDSSHQPNSQESYQVRLSWPVSDSAEWPLNRAYASLNVMPHIGDTLIISTPRGADSSSDFISISQSSSQDDRGKNIADTLFARFVGIPFNDSIRIFKGESAVDPAQAAAKGAF
jgi:hypothetical protein